MAIFTFIVMSVAILCLCLLFSVFVIMEISKKIKIPVCCIVCIDIICMLFVAFYVPYCV